MRLILFLLLFSITANAQLQSFITKGDTVYSYNPLTRVYVQMNKNLSTATVNKYTVHVQALTSSLDDSTTYYFGELPKVPSASAGVNKVYIQNSGIIKSAEIYCYSETTGTNEAWPVIIRLNNTTDFLIATVSASTNERVFSNTALSIPVAAGDYFEVKTLTPTWATNPTNSTFGGYVLIQDTIGYQTPLPPKSTLSNSLNPPAGDLIIDYAAGTWKANQVLESSFFYDSATSKTKIYYTGSSDVVSASFDNKIGLSNSVDMATFTTNPTNPIIGQGQGGAPAGRRAHSSWIGKLGNTYYALCTNGYGYNYSGEDRNIYGYTSTDGVTWVDRGLKINKSTAWGGGALSGFGNTSIVTDQYGKPIIINSKYVALVEASAGGVWELFRAQADSLMGTWAITDRLTSLKVVNGAMYGGACTIYVNGTYHAFYHYGSVAGNLPTYLAYSTSIDGITWAIKEAPFKTISVNPYPNTDQIADPFVCEINGKVYMMAEYVQNSPVYHGQIRLWSYNGTFLQLINSIK